LATGVTKSQLTTGYTINTTLETLTGGTISSTGTCTTTQPWYVTAPTPTPTPTATDSGVPLTAIQAQGPYQSCNNACSAYNSNQSFTTFYATEEGVGALTSLQGTMYTQNIASYSFEASAGWYYSQLGYIFEIGSNGVANTSMSQCNVEGTCGGGVIV
jgi:hypothetical protein